MKNTSELDFFYPGKGVTDEQMSDYVADVYTKLQTITDNAAPCILFGAVCTVKNSTTISCTAGSFRFKNATINSQEMPIFGASEAKDITITEYVSGNIVARYTVSDSQPELPTYFITVDYLFVASPNPDTDIILAELVSGGVKSNSSLVKRYINKEATKSEAIAGVSNSAALTPQQLSTSFAEQAKDLILQNTGYYTLPGYSYSLFPDPKANPCRKRMVIYGDMNSLQTTYKTGSVRVTFDSTFPITKDLILNVVICGICTVVPKNGQPLYNCAIYTLKDAYYNDGFNMYPATPFNGDATYTYHGSYTALAYSAL